MQTPKSSDSPSLASVAGAASLPDMRVNGRVKCQVRAEAKYGDQHIVGFAEDISREGMFLGTKSPFSQGSLVSFSLELDPFSAPIEIFGRVVRADVGGSDPGMAVAFVTGGVASERLDAAVDELAFLERTGKVGTGAPSQSKSEPAKDKAGLSASQTPPRLDLEQTKKAREIRELRKALQTTRKERARLTDRVVRMENDLAAERARVRRQLEDERRAHRQNTERAAKTMRAEWSKRLEQAEAARGSAERAVGLMEARCRVLTEEVEKLRAGLKQAEEEHRTILLAARRDHDDRLRAEQKTEAEMRETIAELEHSLDQALQQGATIREDQYERFTQMDATVKRLEQEVEEGQREQTRWDEEREHLVAEREVALQRVDLLSMEIERLAAELADAQSWVEMKQNVVDELQAELEESGRGAADEQERLLARIADLEDQLAQARTTPPQMEPVTLGQPMEPVDLGTPVAMAPSEHFTPPAPALIVPAPTRAFVAPAPQPELAAPVPQPELAAPVPQPEFFAPAPQAEFVASIPQPVAALVQPMAQIVATDSMGIDTTASAPLMSARRDTQDWAVPEELTEQREVVQHRRWTDSADPGDLRYLGIGRRLSHWVEQALVRFAPGRVDLDDIPDWSRDD